METKGRTDTASRIIHASPQTIYRALPDPDAIVKWRPPVGMRGHVYAFDAREGGTFRMSFSFTDANHEVRGKTSDDADVFEGRFVELVPDERVVELVEFVSDDPAFAGAMKITTSLKAAPDGTEVTIRCDNVPEGITPEDHAAGMTSTLSNLAAFTE